MKKLITLSLLSLSPAAAFGADLMGKAPSVIRQPPATAAVSDSSGFYIGVNVGAGFGDVSASAAAVQAVSNSAVNDTRMTRSGGLGGVQAGFAVQSGSLVYGVEPFIGLRRYRRAEDEAPALVDAVIVALGLGSLVNDAEHDPHLRLCA